MFRLRISKSYGGEMSMMLLSIHAFSSKELALAEAMKVVPEDATLNWTTSPHQGDIKFDFSHNSMRFQVWIDEMPVDVPLTSLTKDMTTTQIPVWNDKKGFHFDHQ